MSFKVVTCCTHIPRQDYYCFESFVKSLEGNEAFNLASMSAILKEGWGGLATKTKWLKKALQQNLITEDILIVTDCFDVVFSRPLDKLIEAYRDYNKPIVASTEKNYWPEEGLKPDFDKHNFQTSFKYLNSGMIVGERDAFVEILESMDLDNYPDDHRKEDGTMFHSNDQFLYQNEFVKHPEIIGLDYLCKVNQSMNDVKEDEIGFIEGGIKNIETGSEPASVHWNGGSKTDWSMEKILTHLNLL
jgi:hypothetical protein